MSTCTPACIERNVDVTLMHRKDLDPEDSDWTELRISIPRNDEGKLLLVKETETPIYSIESLIANFGGMAGIMVGMSVLSVFEIIICLLLCVAEVILRLPVFRQANNSDA